jgi:transposase
LTSAGAGSSRTSTATAAARVTHSTASATSCTRAPSVLATGSAPAWLELLDADERHDEVTVAWHSAQQVRAVYHAPTPAAGRASPRRSSKRSVLPGPEIARLGKTLRRWRTAFLAYFDTGGTSNGGTEAINGLIELHRRIARGFRNPDNYRLRVLLVAGDLNT